MSTKIIVNGKMVTKDNIINESAIIIEHDRIVECGPKEKVVFPKDAEIIDAKGDHVIPGFVDIHCHGGGGFSFHENPDEVASIHLNNNTDEFYKTCGTLEHSVFIHLLNRAFN